MKDFQALIDKYPMVHLSAWNPDDFDAKLEEPQDKVDWNDGQWEAVAQRLYDGFDANYGVTWEIVRMAVRDEY